MLPRQETAPPSGSQASRPCIRMAQVVIYLGFGGQGRLLLTVLLPEAPQAGPHRQSPPRQIRRLKGGCITRHPGAGLTAYHGGGCAALIPKPSGSVGGFWGAESQGSGWFRVQPTHFCSPTPPSRKSEGAPRLLRARQQSLPYEARRAQQQISPGLFGIFATSPACTQHTCGSVQRSAGPFLSDSRDQRSTELTVPPTKRARSIFPSSDDRAPG